MYPHVGCVPRATTAQHLLIYSQHHPATKKEAVLQVNLRDGLRFVKKLVWGLGLFEGAAAKCQ
jgi:hypothetical protein